MSDKAFVRILNGAYVVFIEFRGADFVAVSIDGHERILKRSDWRVLPVA